MIRISLIILLLAVLPTMAYAGHGTIRETDSQFIVEYEGDADEVITANIVKDKEEKLQEQEEKAKAKEAERLRKFAENSARRREERRAKNIDGQDD